MKNTPFNDKTKLESLELQVAQEMQFAKKYRKGRMNDWHENENLYYGKKPSVPDNRANIGIANTKAQGFVDTLLSKVDTPPSIKYFKGAEEDLMKARHMNGLISKEAKPSVGNWAMKDLLAKKQAILYGRAVFEFHADSVRGEYQSHLTNVDVYNFLVDPTAGGLDIENARYCGRGGVYKDITAIEEGVKSRGYDKELADELILKLKDEEGDGKEHDTDDEKDKGNRYEALLENQSKAYTPKGTAAMWEWYTTFGGVRYYTLYSPEHKKFLKICPLTELFKSGYFPFVTYATNPDLVEFWTPSPMDMVRPLFYAQGVSIDQMLDNAERIIYAMKGVQAGAVKNISSLKFGRNKIVKFNRGVDPNTAVREFETPSINTPINVYEMLEKIGNVESGVSAASRGVAEEEKVGIYEGNLANVSDRLGLLNKSYSNAYHRLGLLFYFGAIEHLNRRTAIEILGNDGVEYVEITRQDIKHGKRMFDIYVEASDAESQSDLNLQRQKVAFLKGYQGDQSVNQKTRFEMEATIAGFEPEDIKRLLDIEEFGNAELMAEAARDIQRIISGDFNFQPNEAATTAYSQKVLDYMRNNKEHLSDKVYTAMALYLEALKPIVIRNMAKKAHDAAAQSGKLDALRALTQGQSPEQQIPQGAQNLPQPEMAGATQGIESLVQ